MGDETMHLAIYSCDTLMSSKQACQSVWSAGSMHQHERAYRNASPVCFTVVYLHLPPNGHRSRCGNVPMRDHDGAPWCSGCACIAHVVYIAFHIRPPGVWMSETQSNSTECARKHIVLERSPRSAKFGAITSGSAAAAWPN